MNSSFLIVGHPDPAKVQIGADHCDTLKESEELIQQNQYKAVALPLTSHNQSDLERVFLLLKEQSPDTLVVAVDQDSDFDTLLAHANDPRVGQICTSYDDPILTEHIVKASQLFDERKQRSDHLKLFVEQNEMLSQVSEELEAKVEQRETKLTKSKRRLDRTNQKIEAMHKALMAIHRASAVGEMEAQLNQALGDFMNLEWTRLIVGQQDLTQMEQQIKKSSEFQLLTIPLMAGPVQLGRVVFARRDDFKFRKDEKNFLQQVAEALTLAFDRLLKLDQSELLKQQWEATFDAIQSPICLTDDEFKIIRSNKAFAAATEYELSEIIGRNCFEVFLGEATPRRFKEMQGQFEFSTVRKDNKVYTYNIQLQKIAGYDRKLTLNLFLFRDVTEQKVLERNILETAKMAELGTIGSSIAHELNNPLGGMISFLQLLKNDKSLSEEQLGDVKEMEKAGQKCKEIIENLLGFSRKMDSSDAQTFDLKDVVKEALQITELQTKSRGIAVSVALPNEKTPLHGYANLLSQALCNLLQVASAAIRSEREIKKTFTGRIRLELTTNKDHYRLSISDNGRRDTQKKADIVFHPELGLTLAYKIIGDHGGQLEILAPAETGAQAIITLPRPDFGSQSQVFDAEI